MEKFNFLNEIKSISEQYYKEKKETSDDYNLFTLLNRESDEVLTHSAMLIDLLDPKGKHGLENEPLKLFLKIIDVNDFELDDVECFKELFIGKINENTTKGGRIDIYIKNKLNQEILIENKIFASEQKNQLLRYYNFAPKSKIIFLTLEGERSKEKDLKFDYIQLSYKDDIINWIEQCIFLSKNRPKLRESLYQYIFLIKKLTNQTTNQIMSEKISKIIEHNFIASTEIYKNYENAYNVLYQNLLEEFKSYSTERFDFYSIEIKEYKNEKSLNLQHNFSNYSINIRIKKKSVIAINILNSPTIIHERKKVLTSNGFKGIEGNKIQPWKITSDFEINNLATVETRKELISLFSRLITETISCLE